MSAARPIYDIAVRYAQGEEMDHNVYRDLIPVTTENLAEMVAE